MLDIFHKLLFHLLHVKKSTRLQELFSEWVKIQIFLADALKKHLSSFISGKEQKVKVRENRELNRKSTDTLSSTLVLPIMYQ